MTAVLRSTLVVCAAAAALMMTQGVARASDPVGVYGIIDKVVFEPNQENAERVQIFGVFAIAKENDRNFYESPQRGVLYFSLRPGKESVTRKEWNDLKEMAGKRQVVAFGNRFELKATIRKPDTKSSPDVYATSLGVVKVRSETSYEPIRAVLDFKGN